MWPTRFQKVPLDMSIGPVTGGVCVSRLPNEHIVSISGSLDTTRVTGDAPDSAAISVTEESG
jgi:hypothetical protein